MSYIYKIVNDINEKVYVGKTEFSLEKRFKEHCKELTIRQHEKRPLYSAMRKYGIEHFHIELIEETTVPEEREVYWIEKLDAYKKGYNATRGGDGKRYLDYDLIIQTYLREPNVSKTAKIANCSKESVSRILRASGIEVISSQELAKRNQSKAVAQIDIETGEVLNYFINSLDAAIFLKQEKLNTARAQIPRCARNERKAAYGYKWQYVDNSKES